MACVSPWIETKARVHSTMLHLTSAFMTTAVALAGCFCIHVAYFSGDEGRLLQGLSLWGLSLCMAVYPCLVPSL